MSKPKRSLEDGTVDNTGGIFGNESLDTFTSFLPILGTAQDAYAFYKNPSWSNAGWLAASLASDVFTGGMAGRAIKALRMANKANDAARTVNRTAITTWEASKKSKAAGKISGADNLRNIRSLQAAGATRQAAIRRADDALFDAGIKVGIDQGVNTFLNAAQLNMLPDFGIYRPQEENGGSIHIKPENRGKFTALKERTGHSATWFKEHGTPAQKRMAVFDLNARHWKH